MKKSVTTRAPQAHPCPVELLRDAFKHIRSARAALTQAAFVPLALDAGESEFFQSNLLFHVDALKTALRAAQALGEWYQHKTTMPPT